MKSSSGFLHRKLFTNEDIVSKTLFIGGLTNLFFCDIIYLSHLSEQNALHFYFLCFIPKSPDWLFFAQQLRICEQIQPKGACKCYKQKRKAREYMI